MARRKFPEGSKKPYERTRRVPDLGVTIGV
jgi:hypothetical protein